MASWFEVRTAPPVSLLLPKFPDKQACKQKFFHFTRFLIISDRLLTEEYVTIPS
jgi:hypothetical protein